MYACTVGGTRGFSVDQLKGVYRELSPMFRPDALVVFRAQVSASGLK